MNLENGQCIVVKTLMDTIHKGLKKAKFTEDMRDLNGDWYGSLWEIEADLGCSVKLYDWHEYTWSN